MDTLPILEFDPERLAIIEPHGPAVDRPAPERGVLCFFNELLEKLVAQGRLEPFCLLGTEMGKHPVYLYRVPTPGGEREIVVAHPGVGAPLAVGLTEDILSLGVRKMVACGGCGVLHPEIALGHPVILTAAVRDEGTSYYYLPPSREAFPHPAAVAALEEACRAMGIEYRLGKTWTTDAYFRETPARRARRIAEGCEVVEMEAAAFFALAQFRGVVFGQVVYGGDLVVPEGWDPRGWGDRLADRELMFDLAVDACLRL
jgi:nucleoside phosphorylase